jgi:tetratricopeptide (TPR) repeat protein
MTHPAIPIRLLSFSMILFLCAPLASAADADPRGLIQAGHWNQARALLEPKVKANPSDAEAAALLSQVKVAFGDVDRAIALAETALKLDGKKAEYHWVHAQACVEQAKGKETGMLKRLSASKCFRQETDTTIALDPKHIKARLYLISFLAGAPAIAGGDKKKAEQVVGDVAAIDPAWGHIARARLVEELMTPEDKKAPSELESLYKKALAAATNSEVRYEAQVALANLYLSPSLKGPGLAEQQAREAAKIDPPRATPYILLSIALASQKKWAELDAGLAEAEKAVPDNLGPYYQAGRIIYTQGGGDDARAERYFRKFLTQTPEPGPTLAHAHWRLGLTLEKQGKKAEAIAELEEATRLKPDLEDAKKDLRRLRGA